MVWAGDGGCPNPRSGSPAKNRLPVAGALARQCVCLLGTSGCAVLPSIGGISADRGPGAPRRARRSGAASHRPVTISQDGNPVAALISIDDLADLEDQAALAAHLADWAAERDGIGLEELDAALDRIDAETLS
jgi:PHD/YefM family antitoxin component YafN of YafNO toxin-antitoxin module